MLKFAKRLVPATTAEAHEMLLANRGARVLGGGLWLRQGRRAIARAIDLSACGLDYIEESDDAFVVGAMTPLADLEHDAAFNSATCGVFEHAVHDLSLIHILSIPPIKPRWAPAHVDANRDDAYVGPWPEHYNIRS